MEEKFVRALLNECDNEEEIDQVFELIKENDIQKRCDFLIEKDCQYFDLPKEPDGLYQILKIMYVHPNAKFGRKRRALKEVLKIIL